MTSPRNYVEGNRSIFPGVENFGEKEIQATRECFFVLEIAIFYDAILGNLVRNFHRNRSKVDAEDDCHINNLLQFYITHN